jgi:hypothetical protein
MSCADSKLVKSSLLQQRLLVHLGAERVDLGTHQATVPVLGQSLLGLLGSSELLACGFLAAKLM